MLKPNPVYSDQNVAFRDHVNQMVRTNDQRLLLDLMNPGSYPTLTKEQKETHIFRTALSYSKFYIGIEKFIEYLIFDYKINEAIYNSITHPDKNQQVEDMFRKRNKPMRLAQELTQELEINRDNPNPRPKV